MRSRGRSHHTDTDERIYFTYDKFLFSEELHDVVFQFEGSNETIPAHSQILAFVSEVFRTQFFGSLPEKTIKIEDATIDAFRAFLRCIYTGKLQVTLENMFELAYLANKYLISKITEKVALFFKSKINEDDKFWKLFNPRMIALFDNKGKIINMLLSRFEKRPAIYLNDESFLSVEKDIVGQLVRTEPLAVREADLLKVVARWATHQIEREDVKLIETSLRDHVDDFIHELRLPTLGLNELVYTMRLHSIPFLLPEEKALLASYCAGLVSQPIPFRKLPRHGSLDVLICTAGYQGDCLTEDLVSFFVPYANYRFFGLSCVLNIVHATGGTPGPEQINFELRSSATFDLYGVGYDTVCSFEWKSKSGLDATNHQATCLARDLIPLVAGRNYSLILRPSSGITIHSFNGSYQDNVSLVRVKANEDYAHGIKSLHLLPP